MPIGTACLVLTQTLGTRLANPASETPGAGEAHILLGSDAGRRPKWKLTVPIPGHSQCVLALRRTGHNVRGIKAQSEYVRGLGVANHRVGAMWKFACVLSVVYQASKSWSGHVVIARDIVQQIESQSLADADRNIPSMSIIITS